MTAPTCGSRLTLSPEDAFPTFQECGEPAGHRGPHYGAGCSWTALDHSGVAGEPEATTKEAPEIAVAVSPTRTHAPTPETPGAVNVAGGVTVPDEAVEAAARADHAFGRLGDDPDWDGMTDTDRDSYRRAASSYLTAAAPLIVEHYLRERVEAVSVPDDGVAPWVHDRAAAGIAVQALRSAVEALETEIGKAPGLWGPQAALAGVGDAIDWFRRRADELERGGDQ